MTDPDAIDDMLAGITGFLGVSVPRGSARHVGLRALAESTIYRLVEHAAANPPQTAPAAPSLSLLQVAELLYEHASGMWARDVLTALEALHVVTPDVKPALEDWCTSKRIEEIEGCSRG